MFWSGNYIAVRELNFLLKEENVSLTQVLEADDILQECKADNKALIAFLTRPEILAELITLITEEPPKNVELTSQYRHASIACEVLTSHLSTIADRLSLDTVQMNRLCDFINKKPPLNPLLASYFSKTVEMLLERSPKQDWYLYHIVCLRVLDFFRSRRDFLPNLLRHLATSAIADTFKYLLRLDDLFNKIVMEWLDEHQFLESLIQIICGTYVPEPIRPSDAPEASSAPETTRAPDTSSAPETSSVPDTSSAPETSGAPDTSSAPVTSGAPKDDSVQLEKGDVEANEKSDVNHKEESGSENVSPVVKLVSLFIDNWSQAIVEEKGKTVNASSEPSGDKQTDTQNEFDQRSELSWRRRYEAVASANAAALLTDLILNGEGCTSRLRTAWTLVSRLQTREWVNALLGGMFTAPPHSREHAVVHGCRLLLALLSNTIGGECVSARSSVELAIAPHLPLLHQALLHPPRDTTTGELEGESKGGRVGAARIHVAALLAQLAGSELEDVATTIITLGTCGVLTDLFFAHAHNNFLHAQLLQLLQHALANREYRAAYAEHLLVECDILTRLVDAFEENENKRAGSPRAGYMGYVLLMLRTILQAAEELYPPSGSDRPSPPAPPAPPALARARDLYETKLKAILQQHSTPLGGYYPSENVYEVENTTDCADTMEVSYEFNDMSGNALDDIGEDGGPEFGCDPAETGDGAPAGRADRQTICASSAKSAFLELANQRFDDNRPTNTSAGRRRRVALPNECMAVGERYPPPAPRPPARLLCLDVFVGRLMWDDSPEEDADEARGEGRVTSHDVNDVLAAVAPWETSTFESASGSGGGGLAEWAQFDANPAPPIDPFAPQAHTQELHRQEFTPFWPSSDDTNDIPDDIMRLSQFSISDTFPDQIQNTNDINIDNLPKQDTRVDNQNASLNSAVNNIDKTEAADLTNTFDDDNYNNIKSDTNELQRPEKCDIKPSVKVIEKKEHNDS